MSIDWPRVFSRVKAALMKRGRSEHDADDLVQEAWVRLACYERDNTVEQPEAFLMRAAINLSIDAHRLSAKRGEQVMLEDLVHFDGSPGVEDVLLGRERLARLSECISLLDDQTRKILLAHRIDGLTYQEIARQHGIGITSVHRSIAKALLQIAERMEGWYP
jgi:RNA polymerase sigma-70 factor (ECF subfamily)